MIIFLRSTDCTPDSRVQKYTDYLESCKKNYKVVGWNRHNRVADNNKYTFYHKSAPHGNGTKNLFAMLGFNVFILRYLWQNKDNYQIIHACDFDTVMPAIVIKLLFGKKVIYDIFDWFVDSRNFHNNLLKKIILFFERVALKNADVTIICDEERITQLNYIPRTLWTLPNIPNFNSHILESKSNLNDKIVLSYVGVLSEDRNLQELLDAVSRNQQINLQIAGFGILEHKVKEYANKYENITFWGSVPYKDGLNIMNQSDIIVAFYEKRIKNNIYAAPNKYYESLFLGKPLLTTRGTLVGLKCEKYHTGFAIEEGEKSIAEFFSTIVSNKIVCEYGANAKRLWQTNFSTYVEHFMENNYLKYIS